MRYEQMGNEMIKNLGLENKMVILFWNAYENKSYKVCEKIYRKYKYRA